MVQKPEYDTDTHHLLIIKRPPDSLYAFRERLAQPQHRDIFDKAKEANTFEEVIGIVAAELSIALDGVYEPDNLLTMLAEALDNRGKFNSQPWRQAGGLVNAELVERDETITLEEREEEEFIIPPSQDKKGIITDV